MWYLHFFNPPKKDDLRGLIFETDKMGTPPEDGYTYVYTLTDDGKMSGCWILYNDEGYFSLGIVPDGMNITPFLQTIFKEYHTISTDESVFEDALGLKPEMTQNEIDIVWNFLFLSQMLARRVVTTRDPWALSILSQVLDYMSILDRYNLFFSSLNFFAPSQRALNLHDEIIRNKDKDI